MEQIPLKIAQRLAYTPDEFLVHNGVRSVVDLSLAEARNFRLIWVVGAHRSGKTHFAIKIANDFAKKGRVTRLLDGDTLNSKVAQIGVASSNDVVIVDDMDHYLDSVKAGESGPLVRLIEDLRTACATLILISEKNLSEFNYDAHIGSRLLASTGALIGDPAADEIPELINKMAKQRGIKLTPNKREFLSKRLGRTVSELEEYLERVDYLSTLFGTPIKSPLLSDAI